MFRQSARNFLDHLVARIGDRIDGMTETDDNLLRFHTLAYVSFGFVRRGITILDLERDLVRAAMFRATQRTDTSDDR